MQSGLNKKNKAGKRGNPSLLLHVCCAPCSTSVYEKLCTRFDLTLYWYNPNIFPLDEHNKRLNEIKRLSKVLDFKLIIDSDSANHQRWRQYQNRQFNNLAIQQLFAEPEGGARCRLCYQMRLEKVVQYALAHTFDYFATTLTVSPYKNTPKITASMIAVMFFVFSCDILRGLPPAIIFSFIPLSKNARST